MSLNRMILCSKLKKSQVVTKSNVTKSLFPKLLSVKHIAFYFEKLPTHMHHEKCISDSISKWNLHAKYNACKNVQQKKMFVSTLKAFVLLFFKVQSSIVHLILSYLWKLNALELFMDDIGDVNVVIVGVLAAAVHLIISNKR